MDRTRLVINKLPPVAAPAGDALAVKGFIKPGLGDSIGLAGAIAKLAEASKLRRYEQTLEAMARELAQVGDKERRKLAEQLHDEFGQDLILVKLKLDMLFDAVFEDAEVILPQVVHRLAGAITHNGIHLHEIHVDPKGTRCNVSVGCCRNRFSRRCGVR